MPKQRELAVIANEQGGYFTARQALTAGYSYRDQHYHTTRSNWLKEARGIYRLRDYPLPSRPDLVVVSLLSHDRSGKPQVVVSHESALSLFELSDANPARIHLTVRPGFRKNLGERVFLHTSKLEERDWEEHQGYRVTTPLRTLLDIATTPASWAYLPDAVYDALRRGLVRSSQLLLAEGDERTKTWIHTAVEAADQRIGRSAGIEARARA